LELGVDLLKGEGALFQPAPRKLAGAASAFGVAGGAVFKILGDADAASGDGGDEHEEDGNGEGFQKGGEAELEGPCPEDGDGAREDIRDGGDKLACFSEDAGEKTGQSVGHGEERVAEREVHHAAHCQTGGASHAGAAEEGGAQDEDSGRDTRRADGAKEDDIGDGQQEGRPERQTGESAAGTPFLASGVGCQLIEVARTDDEEDLCEVEDGAACRGTVSDQRNGADEGRDAAAYEGEEDGMAGRACTPEEDSGGIDEDEDGKHTQGSDTVSGGEGTGHGSQKGGKTFCPSPACGHPSRAEGRHAVQHDGTGEQEAASEADGELGSRGEPRTGSDIAKTPRRARA
jgi:hypothetical protein